MTLGMMNRIAIKAMDWGHEHPGSSVRIHLDGELIAVRVEYEGHTLNLAYHAMNWRDDLALEDCARSLAGIALKV